MPVFVADLDEECLLGYNYLTRMDACVDFRQKRMTVRGHDVPFLHEVRRAEVVTTKRLRLPPRTEGRVQCHLTHVMKEAEGLVEPVSDLRLADGVALGRNLVGAGEELVTVLLANFSDKAQNIPAGTPVGACEEVQQTKAWRQGERPHVAGPLPGFLEDLVQRSATHLTEAQTERIHDTLSRHADVFSQGDLDRGRTLLVKHTINTGTSAPPQVPASLCCTGPP
ncbi:hypothetical protein E2C01_014900 [Portunus trituberculatus]|uniref:Uncharacterized protein n=1 Tax=Portunus trituberculatus TaxID=210409 RepID=A0A5B7DLA2_PORTR|nr:hypothetical protein [Portunus trituberculatus]